MKTFFSESEVQKLKPKTKVVSCNSKFATIVADPPWPYKTQGPIGNGGRGISGAGLIKNVGLAKTIITWGKVTEGYRPCGKTGFYYRGATEHCLFCVRGKLRLQSSKVESTLHLLERQAHSVKPDYFFRLFEEQSPPPYLEIFARRLREGWASFGNEIKTSIDIPLKKKGKK